MAVEQAGAGDGGAVGDEARAQAGQRLEPLPDEILRGLVERARADERRLVDVPVEPVRAPAPAPLPNETTK